MATEDFVRVQEECSRMILREQMGGRFPIAGLSQEAMNKLIAAVPYQSLTRSHRRAVSDPDIGGRGQKLCATQAWSAAVAQAAAAGRCGDGEGSSSSGLSSGRFRYITGLEEPRGSWPSSSRSVSECQSEWQFTYGPVRYVNAGDSSECSGAAVVEGNAWTLEAADRLHSEVHRIGGQATSEVGDASCSVSSEWTANVSLTPLVSPRSPDEDGSCGKVGMSTRLQICVKHRGVPSASLARAERRAKVASDRESVGRRKFVGNDLRAVRGTRPDKRERAAGMEKPIVKGLSETLEPPVKASDEVLKLPVKASDEVLKLPVKASDEVLKLPVKASGEVLKLPVKASGEVLKPPVKASGEVLKLPVKAPCEVLRPVGPRKTAAVSGSMSDTEVVVRAVPKRCPQRRRRPASMTPRVSLKAMKKKVKGVGKAGERHEVLPPRRKGSGYSEARMKVLKRTRERYLLKQCAFKLWVEVKRDLRARKDTERATRGITGEVPVTKPPDVCHTRTSLLRNSAKLTVPSKLDISPPTPMVKRPLPPSVESPKPCAFCDEPRAVSDVRARYAEWVNKEAEGRTMPWKAGMTFSVDGYLSEYTVETGHGRS